MKILLIAVAVIYIYRYDVVVSQNASNITTLARTILHLGLLFVLFLIVGHYLRLIRSVSRMPLQTVMYALVGAVSLSWLTLYDFKTILSDAMLILLFFGFIVLCGISGESLCKDITERVPLREMDKRRFFLHYPPNKRTDFLLYDLVIVLILGMPFILKNTVWR